MRRCPCHGLLVLLLLLAVSCDGLRAQTRITTRRQQLEILERDKVSRLWPERQSEIVKIVNQYVERGLTREPEGTNGFQPVVLGGMRSRRACS